MPPNRRAGELKNMAGSSALATGMRGEVENGAGNNAASVGGAEEIPNPLLKSGKSMAPSMVGSWGIWEFIEGRAICLSAWP